MLSVILQGFGVLATFGASILAIVALIAIAVVLIIFNLKSVAAALGTMTLLLALFTIPKVIQIWAAKRFPAFGLALEGKPPWGDTPARQALRLLIMAAFAVSVAATTIAIMYLGVTTVLYLAKQFGA